MYLGNPGEKITATAALIGIYEYTDYKFSYNGTTHYIYTLKTGEGAIIVWKTTSFLSIKTGEKVNGVDKYYPVNKGDVIEITGTVKEHSTYKDTEQTVIQRAKVKQLVKRAETYEEKKQKKQDEQMQSLKDGDFLWTMPYKQYKEHYSDCETVYGSYRAGDMYRHEKATITVIIRTGRLKNSGVRGGHYSGYQMQNELGEKITYRAICEENALKRVSKDFPDHTWECVHIFEYTRYEW